jgi:hypothetical protein
MWPSGKATVFDTVYRRFESYHPSQLTKNDTFLFLEVKKILTNS